MQDPAKEAQKIVIALAICFTCLTVVGFLIMRSLSKQTDQLKAVISLQQIENTRLKQMIRDRARQSTESTESETSAKVEPTPHTDTTPTLQ